MLDLNRRVEIAQAAVDRYAGQPLDWRRADCVRLAGFVRRLAGHSSSLARAGDYASPAGAVRALKRTGFASLLEAVRAQGMSEIPPASRWPGDILAMPSEPGDLFDCSLAIALTNGRILGLHRETGGFAIGAPVAFLTAWRL